MLDPDEQTAGTLTYTVPFTTETAFAASPSGGAVEVTGVRLVEGVGYAELVGATVNEPYAIPAGGTAVFTVLSGAFDPAP